MLPFKTYPLISSNTTFAIGSIMTVTAMLDSHMDRKAVVNMKPSNSWRGPVPMIDIEYNYFIVDLSS